MNILVSLLKQYKFFLWRLWLVWVVSGAVAEYWKEQMDLFGLYWMVKPW